MNSELSQILELILLEVKMVLNELHQNSQQYNLGKSPKSVIVKYHNNFDDQGCNIGNILLAWEVNLNDFTPINNLEIEPKFKPYDQMYFYQGIFWISIKDDLSQFLFEWQVGPRYGRGFLYDIIKDNQKISIKENELIWVS